MHQLKRIENDFIHERCREKFSWTEFGYISADLFFLHKPENYPTLSDGMGAASDMIADFDMGMGRGAAFQRGWNHSLDEWVAAHLDMTLTYSRRPRSERNF